MMSCLRRWLPILGVLSLGGCMGVGRSSPAAQDTAAVALLRDNDGKEVGRAYAAMKGHDLYVFVNVEAPVGKSLGLHRFVIRPMGRCDAPHPSPGGRPLSVSGDGQRGFPVSPWIADFGAYRIGQTSHVFKGVRLRRGRRALLDGDGSAFVVLVADYDDPGSSRADTAACGIWQGERSPEDARRWARGSVPLFQ